MRSFERELIELLGYEMILIFSGTHYISDDSNFLKTSCIFWEVNWDIHLWNCNKTQPLKRCSCLKHTVKSDPLKMCLWKSVKVAVNLNRNWLLKRKEDAFSLHVTSDNSIINLSFRKNLYISFCYFESRGVIPGSLFFFF